MDVATAELVFKKYREGLLKIDLAKSGSRQLDFQSLLFQTIDTRLSFAERLSLRSICESSAQVLSTTRADLFGKASIFLRNGQAEIKRIEGCAECWLLGTSILESASAYMEFRQGRFEEARRRTLVSMDADLALEQEHAYGLLEMHRIQSVNNLMRIALREGDAERALALAGRIVAYLDGRAAGLPVHHSWLSKTLYEVPKVLRRAMMAQVANEAVLALHALPNSNKNWQHFYEPLEGQDTITKCSSPHPRILQWVHAKDAFARERWDLYLDQISLFLPGGREDIAPIWYSCVIDFLEFCRLIDTHLSRYVRSAILRDSAKWPSVPVALRSLLCA